MNGHPAIAYLVAQHTLEERREEARSHQKARSRRKSRSVRFGRYRLSITKDVRDVPRTV